jgi:shikimate kinase
VVVIIISSGGGSGSSSSNRHAVKFQQISILITKQISQEA